MTKYAKHSAVFFLFTFTAYLVAGSVMKGQPYYAANFGSGQSTLSTTCDNPTHLMHFNQAQDFFKTAKELPTGNEQSAAVVNCSISLNILPASTVFVFEPGYEECALQYSISLLTAQSYIYQEPDPPRLS